MCDEAKGTVSQAFSLDRKIAKCLCHFYSTPLGVRHSSSRGGYPSNTSCFTGPHQGGSCNVPWLNLTVANWFLLVSRSFPLVII